MQSGQNLARIVAISAAQHTVEQAPGDQGHERARNAVAGAVPNHHGIAVADGLEPEEIAADDIARFPDEEMVGGDAIELAARGEHGGLDAAGRAQAL